MALLGGCALSSNVNSQYTRGERIVLTPVVSSQQGILPLGPLAIGLAPEIIRFGTAKLKEFYARESELYVASYTANRVGEDFYQSDTSLEFTFDAIELLRFATEKASGKEVPVASIRLRWVTNVERTLFALQPERIQVHKAKTKLRSGDKDLDLTIRVKLDGYWQVKSGELKSKTLGDAVMVLRNIRLGETYLLNGNHEQSWLEDSNGNKDNYDVQTPWMAPVPVSVSNQGNRLENARGNYNFTVTITETDDYGERVARFGSDAYDARDIFIDLLEGLE
jgi:hypothetical protein